MIYQNNFVPLHMRRIVSCIIVAGCLIRGLEVYAQNRQMSPFNTIGYSYRRAVVIQHEEDDVDTESHAMDEFTDVEQTTLFPPDSIRPYMPMVSLPLKNIRISSPFGMRRDPMNRKSHRMHSGVDLRARYEEVYSMLPGTVTAASYSVNGGNYITVNHGICVCSYLHLSKIKVYVGQHVNAGQPIAVSGNTGKRTTGPHLHISCRLGDERGKFFDPMLILGFVSDQLLNYQQQNHH